TCGVFNFFFVLNPNHAVTNGSTIVVKDDAIINKKVEMEDMHFLNFDIGYDENTNAIKDDIVAKKVQNESRY
ncbi:unnamed protein product, partial [Sphenostylis stenocarpa]